MRGIETIDSELRLLLAIRHMAREAEGLTPNTARIDALLDERLTNLVGDPHRRDDRAAQRKHGAG